MAPPINDSLDNIKYIVIVLPKIFKTKEGFKMSQKTEELDLKVDSDFIIRVLARILIHVSSPLFCAAKYDLLDKKLKVLTNESVSTSIRLSNITNIFNNTYGSFIVPVEFFTDINSVNNPIIGIHRFSPGLSVSDYTELIGNVYNKSIFYHQFKFLEGVEMYDCTNEVKEFFDDPYFINPTLSKNYERLHYLIDATRKEGYISISEFIKKLKDNIFNSDLIPFYNLLNHFKQ